MSIDRSNVANERSVPLASSFATSYAGVLAFIAVVNEGSFAKAGDRLGIGRSAVSRSVQRLEGQLNARLFHRTTRCTSLTSEGEIFYARCQPGVMHIAQALEEMRELRALLEDARKEAEKDEPESVKLKHMLADAREMVRTFATLDPAWQALQRVAKMFGLQ